MRLVSGVCLLLISCSQSVARHDGWCPSRANKRTALVLLLSVVSCLLIFRISGHITANKTFKTGFRHKWRTSALLATLVTANAVGRLTRPLLESPLHKPFFCSVQQCVQGLCEPRCGPHNIRSLCQYPCLQGKPRKRKAQKPQHKKSLLLCLVLLFTS